MLVTLIQRYDKKSFHFKNERLTEILQAVRSTFYDCINSIYEFIKPFLDNKMSIFEEYGAFKNLFLISETEPCKFSWGHLLVKKIKASLACIISLTKLLNQYDVKYFNIKCLEIWYRNLPI